MLFQQLGIDLTDPHIEPHWKKFAEDSDDTEARDRFEEAVAAKTDVLRNDMTWRMIKTGALRFAESASDAQAAAQVGQGAQIASISGPRSNRHVEAIREWFQTETGSSPDALVPHEWRAFIEAPYEVDNYEILYIELALNHDLRIPAEEMGLPRNLIEVGEAFLLRRRTLDEREYVPNEDLVRLGEHVLNLMRNIDSHLELRISRLRGEA